ncbi:hypothetical protein BDZ89DRAFT_450922 [Hymenopellis radicata]|nr:hypothetical protein BDZ89DRAFT_450922 [Hymenopellis radicata]
MVYGPALAIALTTKHPTRHRPPISCPLHASSDDEKADLTHTSMTLTHIYLPAMAMSSAPSKTRPRRRRVTAGVAYPAPGAALLKTGAIQGAGRCRLGFQTDENGGAVHRGLDAETTHPTNSHTHNSRDSIACLLHGTQTATYPLCFSAHCGQPPRQPHRLLKPYRGT